MQRALIVTTEPVGALSRIGCEPGLIVTKIVTKVGTVVPNLDPTLHMYQGCDNATSGNI